MDAGGVALSYESRFFPTPSFLKLALLQNI